MSRRGRNGKPPSWRPEGAAFFADAQFVASRAFPERDGRGEGGGEIPRVERRRLRSGGEGGAVAQEKDVGEERRDFLDVVRDEHERRRLRLAAECAEEAQEVLARDGVKASARLVEDEDAQLSPSTRDR